MLLKRREKEKAGPDPTSSLFLCRLDSAFNLTGTQASRTDIDMTRRTVNNCLDALHIGLPSLVGASVGMGDFDTESNALTAKIALCHLLHLLANKNLNKPF